MIYMIDFYVNTSLWPEIINIILYCTIFAGFVILVNYSSRAVKGIQKIGNIIVGVAKAKLL